MFLISKRPTNMRGQVLLVVLKDGKTDKGDNAYVQQQVPEDFADWLIRLNENNGQLETALNDMAAAIVNEPELEEEPPKEYKNLWEKTKDNFKLHISELRFLVNTTKRNILENASKNPLCQEAIKRAKKP